MYETIKSIIEEQLGITDKNKITQSTNLQSDLNADSLDAVEIIMSIEDEFEIEIPDSIAEELKTVEDILDYLDSQQ